QHAAADGPPVDEEVLRLPVGAADRRRADIAPDLHALVGRAGFRTVGAGSGRRWRRRGGAAGAGQGGGGGPGGEGVGGQRRLGHAAGHGHLGTHLVVRRARGDGDAGDGGGAGEGLAPEAERVEGEQLLGGTDLGGRVAHEGQGQPGGRDAAAVVGDAQEGLP